MHADRSQLFSQLGMHDGAATCLSRPLIIILATNCDICPDSVEITLFQYGALFEAVHDACLLLPGVPLQPGSLRGYQLG